MKNPAAFKRTDRIAELIKQELAGMILTEVKDPRVAHVNITKVVITRDLSIARIQYLLVGVQGDPRAIERAKAEAAEGLARSNGFLRRELGKRVEMRITPRLDFYWDDGIEHGRKMDQILAEIARDRVEQDKGES